MNGTERWHVSGNEPEIVDAPNRKLTSDSPWRQRIREQAGTTGVQHKAVASKFPARASQIQSSLSKWTNGARCSAPSIPSILEVARIIDYPVIEQLIDLGYLSYEDLELIDSPLLSPSWLLQQRLELALSENRMMSSGVADLVVGMRSNILQTSGLAPSDLARWRAKIFDIPAGTDKYRHIGYHAVEFEAWLGPDLDVSENSHLLNRGKIAKEAIERLIPSPTERSAKLKRIVDQRTDSLPIMVGALERLEIEERIRVPRANGHFNSYGLEGSLVSPLMHGAGTGPRHIYVESASSRTDVREARPLVLDAGIFSFMDRFGEMQTSTKVLLVAPAAVAPLPLANLVGRALGWDVLSLRQSAGAVGGSLIRQTEQMLAARPPIDRAARSFRTASRPSIMVASYLEYLVLTEEGKRLISDGSVIPILLRPTLATLESWEARQKIGQKTLNPMTPQRSEELLDGIEACLNARAFGNFEVLQFKCDMDWWPMGMDGKFADRAQFFEHPTVGDIRLLAAYQLAYLLTHGVLPGARASHTYFLNGPIARFGDQLSKDRSRPLRTRSRRKQS
ncbi:hypothetical protein [Glutamicibacter sp. NPDC087344]|uniref:hypothetical protein n=1 Tax=Glutamicibacter sp. NPDC087344 TaxID=3363994 RepID=UPI0037F24E12